MLLKGHSVTTWLIFHKDVYIPDFAKAPVYVGALRYSRHARNVSGQVPGATALALPETFDGTKGVLVECELSPCDTEVTKQVWRLPYDSEFDLCFPLLPDGTVPTVWLNHRKDQHSTLARNKYVGGAQWRKMRNKLTPVAA